MTIFSLPPAMLTEIYLLLNDPIPKDGFPLVCKNFTWVKQQADYAKNVCRFVTENYDLLPSSFTKWTPSTLYRWNVMIVGEAHISSRHRKINSELINLVGQTGLTEVFTETGDDCQIPFAHEWVKNLVQCWDIPNKLDLLLPIWTLLDVQCKICAAYLNCLSDEGFNFNEFDAQYFRIKHKFLSSTNDYNLHMFYGFHPVAEITEKAKNTADPIIKNELSIELINLLCAESKAASEYFRNFITKQRPFRDALLVHKTFQSISRGKMAIVVAGSEHAKSEEVVRLSKIRGVSCISLEPKRLSTPSTVETDVWNLIDSESNFWSELSHIMKLPKEVKEREDFFSLHQSLLSSIKLKMKNYKHHQDTFECQKSGEHGLYLWAEFPKLIYPAELDRLKNIINDAENIHKGIKNKKLLIHVQ